MAERFKGPTEPDARQKEILDEIARTRTTGTRGPFGPWLANPDLAQTAQGLGRICRYETDLPLRESEIVILTTAKACNCKLEWDIHVEEARKAGVPEDVIGVLDAGKQLEGDSREAALQRFAHEVASAKHASDAAYADMKKYFSDKEIVETVAVSGYYSFVAMTLNVFQI
ncbi:Hypothetical Protein FCC1311_093862 [Hondaea fermentalgiana]|uniref:Carboxymuconolactone decarboxylase-like domain-containing protein n=1 Tax=Hondaea fermentalgiana TaxID=2315210 RepID=A0A2R5GQL1_9STRA|nr:Hypothetical Protein FCC1311_093862 [Hondaea fermentalgiana]|eukprot:GBG33162.1 Hypothetical Protein FCC1311_093862 [Hondaea fermentalgiana]